MEMRVRPVELALSGFHGEQDMSFEASQQAAFCPNRPGLGIDWPILPPAPGAPWVTLRSGTMIGVTLYKTPME